MRNRLFAILAFTLPSLFSASVHAARVESSDPRVIRPVAQVAIAPAAAASAAAADVAAITVDAGKKRLLIAWASWDQDGLGHCQNAASGAWAINAAPTKGTTSSAILNASIAGCYLSPAFLVPYNGLYYTANAVAAETTDTLTATWTDGAGTVHQHTFNITIRPVGVAKNNGKPECPSCSGGNPINGATGNKYQQETDFVAGGATGLALRRVYNSQDENVSAFGARWRSNWQGKLTVLNGGATVAVLRPEGRQETFKKNASNLYVSDADVRTRLSATTGGWRLVAANDDMEDYTSDGRLSTITTRAGRVTTLSYDASGRLTQVAGPFGHKLTFAYDASNRISQMTAPDGQVYKYAYDANNNLVAVTYPDAKIRQYVYDNVSLPNALTGIVDENGGRFATFAYKLNGFALSTEHAGGVE